MEEYKLTLGMEPTDDYKKAKQDLIQAMCCGQGFL